MGSVFEPQHEFPAIIPKHLLEDNCRSRRQCSKSRWSARSVCGVVPSQVGQMVRRLTGKAAPTSAPTSHTARRSTGSAPARVPLGANSKKTSQLPTVKEPEDHTFDVSAAYTSIERTRVIEELVPVARPTKPEPRAASPPQAVSIEDMPETCEPDAPHVGTAPSMMDWDALSVHHRPQKRQTIGGIRFHLLHQHCKLLSTGVASSTHLAIRRLTGRPVVFKRIQQPHPCTIMRAVRRGDIDLIALPDAEHAHDHEHDHHDHGHVMEQMRWRQTHQLVQGRYAAIMKEFMIGRTLDHPHIVQVLSSGASDRHLYLAMAHLAGTTLEAYLQERHQLCEHSAVGLFRQLVDAVGYLHSNHIAHRDITPKNLMYDSLQRRIVLIDLSHAAFFLPDQTMSESEGTPAFAAPEILFNQFYHPASVDVWSMGVTLFTMVAGTRPWPPAPDMARQAMAIALEPMARPAHFSSDLLLLVEGMLHRDPALRWTLAHVAASNWACKGGLVPPVKTTGYRRIVCSRFVAQLQASPSAYETARLMARFAKTFARKASPSNADKHPLLPNGIGATSRYRLSNEALDTEPSPPPSPSTMGRFRAWLSTATRHPQPTLMTSMPIATPAAGSMSLDRARPAASNAAAGLRPRISLGAAPTTTMMPITATTTASPVGLDANTDTTTTTAPRRTANARFSGQYSGTYNNTAHSGFASALSATAAASTQAGDPHVSPVAVAKAIAMLALTAAVHAGEVAPPMTSPEHLYARLFAEHGLAPGAAMRLRMGIGLGLGLGLATTTVLDAANAAAGSCECLSETVGPMLRDGGSRTRRRSAEAVQAHLSASAAASTSASPSSAPSPFGSAEPAPTALAETTVIMTPSTRSTTSVAVDVADAADAIAMSADRRKSVAPPPSFVMAPSMPLGAPFGMTAFLEPATLWVGARRLEPLLAALPMPAVASGSPRDASYIR